MNSAGLRDVGQDLEQLFREGSLAGASDARLLERFVAEGDAPSFEALVARHREMLLRTCHDLLGDATDAEEAFQATVVILLRRAGSIREQARARGLAAPRRLPGRPPHPRRGRPPPGGRRAGRGDEDAAVARPTRPRPARPRRDPRALHEEIDRLPERYRRPVILCLLEGTTQEQAAARLGLDRGLGARAAGTGKGPPARSLDSPRDRPGRGARGARRAGSGRGDIRAVPGPGASKGRRRLAVVAAGPGRRGARDRGAGRRPAAADCRGRRRRGPARAEARTRGRIRTPRLVPGRRTHRPVACQGPPGRRCRAARRVPRAGDRPLGQGRCRRPGIADHRRLVDARSPRPSAAATAPSTSPRPLATSGVTSPRGAARSPTSRRSSLRPTSPSVPPGSTSGSSPRTASPRSTASTRSRLRMVADRPIEGRLVDEKGGPIAGAVVRVDQLYAVPAGDLSPIVDALRRLDLKPYQSCHRGSGRITWRPRWRSPPRPPAPTAGSAYPASAATARPTSPRAARGWPRCNGPS